MPHADIHTVRVIYKFKELDNVIEVIKRLADAHEDDI